MTSTEMAARTVVELEGKLAATSDRAVALATERRRVAFSAHSGDAAAKKELAKLTSESATIGFDVENLHAALDEARHRLAEAERDEERGRLRQAAKEALLVAETAAERGPRIRDLSRDLCDELKAAIADVRRLNYLGAPITNQRILELALTRTILPMLREAGLDVELIAPGQRHEPEELVNCYVNRVTDWAGRVLDATKAAA